MQALMAFYQDKIKEYSTELSNLKKQLFTSSMLRLIIFLLAAFAIYFTYGNVKWVLGILLITIILFLYLVSRHSNLQYKRDRLNALIQINKTEIEVLQRKFHDLPEGNQYKDPLHYYSQDIDLFGKGSFYQYTNRTGLSRGSETLANILKENHIKDIPKKQEAIRELSGMPKWRQEFLAVASLSKTETSTESIIKWLKNYKTFVPKLMRYLPWAFTVISIGLWVSYFFDVVSESFLFYWCMFGLMITGVFFKKVTHLGTGASKTQSTFRQYNKLLTLIETTDFKSEILNIKKKAILSEGKKTSTLLKEFAGLLSSLDQNNNIFYLILGNGFFLRGLSTCAKIEKWIVTHHVSVEKWFEVIAIFDAYTSLGNFAFNHPDYTYPSITSGNVLTSKGAGHPLLDPEKSVLNDFQIGKEEFFIITGANMAGKSTFLRTVSLQIVMANIGLPVCAKSVEYAPIKLITSMRTTDSLTDDESYFFSELKRLKFVVDEIQTDTYFIVLDEILKGTNSTDKAKGSRQFVERLVTSKSTGIIATHDLSLCEAAAQLQQIKNHYFDAEIVDGELHFDYKFKDGICQNMNASFLLKKMGIVG